MTQHLTPSNRMRETCLAAVERWGAAAQLGVAQEEAAELVAAISRLNRGRHGVEQLLDEAADVTIMLEQVQVIFGGVLFDQALERKLSRLRRVLGLPEDEMEVSRG